MCAFVATTSTTQPLPRFTHSVKQLLGSSVSALSAPVGYFWQSFRRSVTFFPPFLPSSFALIWPVNASLDFLFFPSYSLVLFPSMVFRLSSSPLPTNLLINHALIKGCRTNTAPLDNGGIKEVPLVQIGERVQMRQRKALTALPSQLSLSSQ